MKMSRSSRLESRSHPRRLSESMDSWPSKILQPSIWLVQRHVQSPSSNQASSSFTKDNFSFVDFLTLFAFLPSFLPSFSLSGSSTRALAYQVAPSVPSHVRVYVAAEVQHGGRAQRIRWSLLYRRVFLICHSDLVLAKKRPS